jgi:phosphoenolpyruvate synthase/pyruvate phosphate dikinase
MSNRFRTENPSWCFLPVVGPRPESRSLVAREYGIPAVVATGCATLRLRDGQVVTVDGGAGTVEFGR